MSAPMLREERISTDGISLNLAAGPANGPPLLLLHGVGRKWQDFLTILPTLTMRWQVYALDFRGHGQSDRAQSYFVNDYARDVKTLLRKQRIPTPTVVFGHSLGSLVAATVAQAEPDLVKAVILEDPPAQAMLQNIQESTYYSFFTSMRTLAGPGSSIQAVTRELAELRMKTADGKSVRLGDLRDASSLRFSARCLHDIDPLAYTPLIEGRWLEGYDYPNVFAGIRCPTLLLTGDEAFGGMLPRDDAAIMAVSIADCAHVPMTGVGHLIHWMQADATARLVMGFLESV